MTKLLSAVHSLVWGAPTLLLILGVGICLTVRLKCIQLRLLPGALKMLLGKKPPGKTREVSPLQALWTALAATVGTGNLVGVSGAICLGGPGAVFWMWLCGFLGMATKYAETVLAVRFRVKTAGGYAGGPMYVMEQGLGPGFRPLAWLYCCFGIAAAFGVGNAVQISSAVKGINALTGGGTRMGNFFIGAGLSAGIGCMLLGGARRISRGAQVLVPFGAAVYVAMCTAVLLLRREALPGALRAIVTGAFAPGAVTGGLLGSGFRALCVGCSRGVFTNEAGMGTASMAHALADTDHPARQGMLGIVEVFLDTIVICTMTALAVLVSGVSIPYGRDAGAELTELAFSRVLGPWSSWVIGLELVLFAVATVLGWGLYGARCAGYLFGSGSLRWFAAAQMLIMVLSAGADAAAVWQVSEIFNGLMAIPNLFTLAVLLPEVYRLTKEYLISGENTASGGNYADFHQRKQMRALSHEKIPPSGHGGQKRGQENLSSEYRPAGPSYPSGLL